MSNQQGINTFSKGLNTDSSLLNQPEGTYIGALNITLLNDDGDYHILSNEKGTTEYVSIPSSYNIIGHTVVDDEIVLCLKDTVNGYSQIGVIKDSIYTKKIPVAGEDNELAFTINNPIDIKGKKSFEGNTLVYITDNNEPFVSLDLDNPPTNIAKGKNIIPDIDLPTITYTDIIKGGNLKGGVYQFAVRYLNNELVPTVATLPTNPIPVLASNSSVGIDEVEGAGYEENVNKAIKLSITNIDTDYPYFEFIVIGYEGATSAPVAHIVDTYTITGTSKNIVFSGVDDDSVLTTPEEVLAEPITYSQAKCVEQKDNKLFLSNLTESKSRFADELQTVANNITVKYETKSESEQYYSYPTASADSKTYRRGEVYSLGIGVTFKDGSKSYVYHIPAPDVGGVPGQIVQTANTITKVLGTYLSTDEYPSSGVYPTGNIRHHVIPTIEQVPVYGTGSTSFVKLSLGFEGLSLSQDLQDSIQDIILYREPRNSKEKKSKLAQGFATNIFLGADNYENSSDGGGGDIPIESDTIRRGDATTFHYRKNFGFFNNQLNTYFDLFNYDTAGGDTFKTNLEGNKSQRSTHNGCYYSVKTLDEAVYDRRADRTSNQPLSNSDQARYQSLGTAMNADKFCFHSPETLLGDGVFLNPDSLTGANFVRLARFTNTVTNIEHTGTTFGFKTFAPAGYTKTVEHLAYEGNFNIEYIPTNAPVQYYSSAVTIKDSVYVNNGEKKHVPGLFSYKFDNSYSGKFLYLSLTEPHEQNASSVGNVINMDFPRATAYATVNVNDETFEYYSAIGAEGDNTAVASSTNADLDMYEIENLLQNQYGNIESSHYVPIHINKNVAVTTIGGVLGGDTFITKYTINHKTLVNRFFPFYKSTAVLFVASASYKFFKESWKDSDGNRAFVSTSVHKNTYDADIIPGYCFNSAVSYLVESDINCYYRFVGENGYPYYPLADIDTVWNALPNQEDNRNYNVQYSKDNTINTNLVSRPIFDSAIASYPNRTIYSESSNEDSKVDNYQIFKQESVYDLPEDTGEIIDTFVWNEELFSHTPKALWRNFVNTTTKEATTIGEVVYGSGGLFSLPSKKVITSDGGYGGTLSQFGNAVTPFGYFFVDSLQRKVFKLTNNLEEISLQGMQQYFDENIVIQNDNTFNNTNPVGITMGWDNEYKRLLLTQKGSNEFSISYSPLTKSWISNHSYLPNTYISFDKHLILIASVDTTSLVHTINTGDYGVYFNEAPQEANIKLVFNKAPVYEKVYDNMNVHSKSYSPAFEEFDTFHTIECKNDYQDSGILNILSTNDFDPAIANNEVISRYKKSHHQVALPRDNQEANLGSADGWEMASRMKSKYLITKLVYNNLNNNKFIVNFVEYMFRITAR